MDCQHGYEWIADDGCADYVATGDGYYTTIWAPTYKLKSTGPGNTCS